MNEEIVTINSETNTLPVNDDMNIMETGRNMLEDVRTKLTPANCISVPIAELSALGSGVLA